MNYSDSVDSNETLDPICWLDEKIAVCSNAVNDCVEREEYWKTRLSSLELVRGYMRDRLNSRLDLHIPCKNSTMVISIENDGDTVSVSVGCCLPDGTDFYFSNVAANLLSGDVRTDLMDPVSEEILETTVLSAANMLAHSEYSKPEQPSDGG